METDSKGIKNSLASPAKSPGPKKSKGDCIVTSEVRPKDDSSTTILAAIGTLKDMMTEFKHELKQNTLTISNIAKAVEFNSAEIKECKEKNQVLSAELKQLKNNNMELEKKIKAVEMKAADLERYKRRWNLRLNGLKEEREENTREVVAGIIVKMVPHWKEKMEFILDSVHRLGQNNTDRPRQIIMQFTGRHFRDELWRTTKQHTVCKNLNIRFAEDLTKEDRDARMAIGPKVEQARKAGLKAVFRGPYAFIN